MATPQHIRQAKSRKNKRQKGFVRFTAELPLESVTTLRLLSKLNGRTQQQLLDAGIGAIDALLAGRLVAKRSTKTILVTREVCQAKPRPPATQPTPPDSNPAQPLTNPDAIIRAAAGGDA